MLSLLVEERVVAPNHEEHEDNQSDEYPVDDFSCLACFFAFACFDFLLMSDSHDSAVLNG